jgi:hypothetical protein
MGGFDFGSAFSGSGGYDFGGQAVSGTGGGAFAKTVIMQDKSMLYIAIGVVVVFAMFLMGRK